MPSGRQKQTKTEGQFGRALLGPPLLRHLAPAAPTGARAASSHGDLQVFHGIPGEPTVCRCPRQSSRRPKRFLNKTGVSFLPGSTAPADPFFRHGGRPGRASPVLRLIHSGPRKLVSASPRPGARCCTIPELRRPPAHGSKPLLAVPWAGPESKGITRLFKRSFNLTQCPNQPHGAGSRRADQAHQYSAPGTEKLRTVHLNRPGAGRPPRQRFITTPQADNVLHRQRKRRGPRPPDGSPRTDLTPSLKERVGPIIRGMKHSLSNPRHRLFRDPFPKL